MASDGVYRRVDFGPDALRGIVGHVGGVGGEDRAQVVLTALLGTHARASKASDSDWFIWTRSADQSPRGVRAHRCFAATELGGDLGVGQAGVVAQDEDGPLPARKCAELATEQVTVVELVARADR